MNSDGTVNIERLGMETSWWRDLYHFLLKTTWRQSLLLIAGAYLVLNLAFAVLFWLPGDAIAGAEPGSFLDAFFFSVQTCSTIGYGGMSPAGLYGNVMVTAEALVGLLFTAMSTGLLFAKFATPTSRVRFSRTAIIGTHDGRRVLMFRMANERSNQIVDATTNVAIIREETTKEGEHLRRFYDLPLRRARTPVFSLGWTVYHEITADSPLADKTAEELVAQDAVILVTVMGTDSTLSQTVNARHAYNAPDIQFDRRFVDLVSRGPDGRRRIDYSAFHDTEPHDAPRSISSVVS